MVSEIALVSFELKKTALFREASSSICEEASNLFFSLISRAPEPTPFQIKSENITIIRTEAGFIVCDKDTKAYTEGAVKKCREVAYILVSSLNPFVVTAKNAVILKPSSVSLRDEKFVERFIEEGRVACQLKNIPRMVETFSFGVFTSVTRSNKKETEKPFILAEACDMDLFDFLDNQYATLSEVRKVDLARQMIEAVRNLHEAGYIHGDVKVENFFVKENKTIVLGDFDSTQPVGARFYKIRGTPDFFSSEYAFLKRARESGSSLTVSFCELKKQDVWGLGCALYHLVIGRKIQLPMYNKEKYKFYAQHQYNQTWDIYLGKRFQTFASDNKLHQFIQKLLPLSSQSPMTAQEALEEFNQLY